jgi:hypothetical protein
VLCISVVAVIVEQNAEEDSIRSEAEEGIFDDEELLRTRDIKILSKRIIISFTSFVGFLCVRSEMSSVF